MRQKFRPVKESAEKVVKDIRRATRRQFSAEDEGAERSCRQSEENRESDRLHLGAEFFRDGVHDEDENEEIESIDRPAEGIILKEVAKFIFGQTCILDDLFEMTDFPMWSVF